MQNEAYEKISASPLYRALRKKRNRFSLLLSAIILIVYGSFVIFASTFPTEFAAPIAEGSKWPVGLVIGWCIQGFSFLMTGVYVFRANSDFDDMTRTLVSEANR